MAHAAPNLEFVPVRSLASLADDRGAPQPPAESWVALIKALPQVRAYHARCRPEPKEVGLLLVGRDGRGTVWVSHYPKCLATVLAGSAVRCRGPVNESLWRVEVPTDTSALAE